MTTPEQAGKVVSGVTDALKNQPLALSLVLVNLMFLAGGQPKRAIIGMHDGISAYVRSRASALKWDPPLRLKELHISPQKK